MVQHWSEVLKVLGACYDAQEWAKVQISPEAAWQVCERGDWLLWIAGRRCKHGSKQHRSVVRAACACARLVLPRVPAGEVRPRIAIETAERWCDGTASIEEVRAASASAAAVAAVAASAYASASAYAASTSAAAAAASAYASAYASAAPAYASAADYAAAYAYAAYAVSASAAAAAASAAADAADARAAREKILRQCANIVRAFVTRPDMSKEVG